MTGIVGRILSILALLTIAMPAAAEPQQARPLYDVYDSMGIVIQPAYVAERAWNNEQWPKDLDELGVCNARGRISHKDAIRRLQPFFLRGCKIVTNVVSQSPSVDEAKTKANIAFIAANVNRRNIAGLESANEYNNGRTVTEAAAALKALQPKLRQWINAYPALLGTSLLTPSPYVRDPAYTRALGNLEPNADYWNMHYYNEGRRPLLAGGLTKPGTLAQAVIDTRVMAPTKPGMTTEFGYKHILWDGKANPGTITELAFGKYVGRGYFDLFAAGSVKNFLYSLIDDEPRGVINHGLMDENLSKRESFFMLKRLFAMIRDVPGAGGVLDYSVSGQAPSVRRYTFRKSDGSFLIVLYNDVDSWNRSSLKDINPAPVPVTITLAGSAAMQIFQPLTSDGPIAAANDNRIVVPVADHVTIVTVRPGAPLSAPSPMLYAGERG